MIKNEIILSKNFKKQASKSIASIVLFIIVYLILLGLSIALTIWCVFAGINLISARPSLFMIALGIGLSSLGFLIFIFLIKFVFKSNKIDRAYLIEVTEKEEPELFQMIEDIVTKVGSKFPKKVYLSNEVNASVFYDSNFWSMFFPVEKNLVIGIGLINCVTVDELKAILSHEFGHFSQRTMKVGSYVYNVNQVIYNLLFDNESYDKLIQKWANISGYLSIFVFIATLIVGFIQWILRGMYVVVNKSYLALSREMEFHADEIASYVTGYIPLKTSLLRSELANNSLDSVLAYYQDRFSENLTSKNVYKEQVYVMNFLSKENEIQMLNGFPNVTLEEVNKFNRSKLTIKDQWTSHPSDLERIEQLEKNNVKIDLVNNDPANTIFQNILKTHEDATVKLFSSIKYDSETIVNSFESFKTDFENDYSDNSFSKIYNGYYNNHNPTKIDLSSLKENVVEYKFEDLFSEENINLNIEIEALKLDIDLIDQIRSKQLNVKMFDYDGRKYRRKNANDLHKKLDKELKELMLKIATNDAKIFSFFNSKDKKGKLLELYKNFFGFDEEYYEKVKIYNELTEGLEFVNYTLPFDEIRSKLLVVGGLEVKFKRTLKELLEDVRFQSEISEEIRKDIELYLSKKWQYFGEEKYFENNLEILFRAISDYFYLISRGYFVTKKELLEYQETLL